MAVATSGIYNTTAPKLLPPNKLRVYNGSTGVPAAQILVANASGVTTATFTATGVAAGDVVVGFGVASNLATNSWPLSAIVTGANTITVTFAGTAGVGVTHTAPVMNFIVADVT